MKYLFIITVFMLASCGLPYCHKVQLTEDDLSWINHYKANDTIIFESKYNDLDTLIVDSISINNPRNTFILDAENQNWIEGDHEYYGFAYVDMILKHFPDTFKISFEVKRFDSEDKLVSSCNFCEWCWEYAEIDQKSICLRNKTYKECIRTDTTQMEHMDGKRPIIGLKEVIWNKEQGLLQYSLNNGDVYFKNSK